MKITFVIGIPGSGKSTYISENFKDRKVIDLFDFQKPYNKKGWITKEEVWKSYEDTKEALLECIRNNEDVVLEHTFLRAIRRIPYLEAIKEITDYPIDIVVMKPSLEILRERWIKRKMYIEDDEILNFLNVLEIPSIEEGYSNVIIITE